MARLRETASWCEFDGGFGSEIRPPHFDDARTASSCQVDAGPGPTGWSVAVMRLRGPPPRWIAVALRRLGWDRNPMRRATDRIQALLRTVLLAMLVIGGPIATAYVGHAAYTSAARAARAQAMAWHRVPALILRVGPVATLWQRPDTTGPATLSVRWTTSQGASRTGEIAGRADATPGSVVTVWVTRRASEPSGRMTDHVCGAGARSGGGDRGGPDPAAAALSWAASAAPDRHRRAHWKAEWSGVEPEWTKSSSRSGAS